MLLLMQCVVCVWFAGKFYNIECLRGAFKISQNIHLRACLVRPFINTCITKFAIPSIYASILIDSIWSHFNINIAPKYRKIRMHRAACVNIKLKLYQTKIIAIIIVIIETVREKESRREMRNIHRENVWLLSWRFFYLYVYSWSMDPVILLQLQTWSQHEQCINNIAVLWLYECVIQLDLCVFLTKKYRQFNNNIITSAMHSFSPPPPLSLPLSLYLFSQWHNIGIAFYKRTKSNSRTISQWPLSE